MPIGQSYQNVIARISIYDASLSKLRELYDISNRYREVVDAGLAPKTIRNGFAFEGVSFGYSSNKQPVFNDVSVTVPIGKITAITGPSGAGKTTFVELLADEVSKIRKGACRRAPTFKITTTGSSATNGFCRSGLLTV